MNKIYILFIVLFLCCLILIIGITVYFLNKKKINSSQKNPNENNEKNQVYNLGQILQKDELELTNDNLNMLITVIPSGINYANPVIYSMSFDFYIETPASRFIFSINNEKQSEGDIDVLMEKNHIIIRFSDNNKFSYVGNLIAQHITKSSMPLKQWINITFVVQNNNFLIYFNGINEGSISPVNNKNFQWFKNENFKWNAIPLGIDKNVLYGKIKVKNLVFWDIPLTKSQIDIISKQ